MSKPIIYTKNLGTIDYKEAWDYQQSVHKELVDIKLANRKKEEKTVGKHRLILCEHPPVYTLGKSGSMDHLLLNEPELEERDISFYKINRGGDITHHGPGQLVAYPILDLDYFFTDVHLYVRKLEETIIQLLDSYGIKAGRIPDYTGVWIQQSEELWVKICAIGVHLSRWVTMHGLALNVNNDLDYFNQIIPCGIVDSNKEVTSIKKQLGHEVDMDELKSRFVKLFAQEFEANITSYDQ